METLLAQILAFAAVFLLVLGVPAALRGSREPEEIRRLPPLLRTFHHEMNGLRAFASRFGSPSANHELNLLARIANLPLSADQLRGLQLLLALLLGVSFAILTFLLSLHPGATVGALFLGAFLGAIFPKAWLRGVARRRQEEMARSLPFAIDLLTVAMEAGQDFIASVRHLVHEGLRGPLAEEFGRLLREIELGKSREEALKAMSDRIQLTEFQSLVASVMQSAEMGASIAKTLKIQAEEIRRDRFNKAEKQAARAPSLMLIPMALFILPSVFIIIFTPVIIRVQSSGMGNFLGNMSK